MLKKLKSWIKNWLKPRKAYKVDEWDNWYPDNELD
jgi:hypothetical protein